MHFKWILLLHATLSLSSVFCQFAGQIPIGPYNAITRLSPGHLLGYFPLDGTLLDVAPYGEGTGYGQHGTDTGGQVTWANGFSGIKGAYLDGNASISIPLDINPNKHPYLTMGAWVQVLHYEKTTRCLLSHGNTNMDFARSICLDKSGDTEFGWSAYTGSSDDGVLGALEVSPNEWTLVAVTYDAIAGTTSVYSKGKMISGSASMNGGRETLTIGSGNSENTGFVGIVNHVFVFNTVLNAAELQYLENSRDTIFALPPPVAGNEGYALQFNKNGNQRMYIPSYSLGNLRYRFSISIWFQLLSTPSTEYIILEYSSPNDHQYGIQISAYYDVHQTAQTHLQIRMGTDGDLWDVTWRMPNTMLVVDGTWTHLGITWDGATVTAYHNGVEKGTLSYQLILPDMKEGMTVGTSPNTALSFHGLIDNLQLWNVALYEEEVVMYMGAMPTGNEKHLVGAWRFNEGYGHMLVNDVHAEAFSLIDGELKYFVPGQNDDDVVTNIGVTFIPSTLPPQETLIGQENAMLFLELNGTSSDSLSYQITALPAAGNLYTADEVSMGTFTLGAICENVPCNVGKFIYFIPELNGYGSPYTSFGTFLHCNYILF